MEVDLVAEGVKFMVIGMGTVFLFLIIMMMVLNFQAYIIGKYFPEKVAPVAPSSSSPMDDKGLVAAISAAIQMYKKRNEE